MDENGLYTKIAYSAALLLHCSKWTVIYFPWTSRQVTCATTVRIGRELDSVFYTSFLYKIVFIFVELTMEENIDGTVWYNAHGIQIEWEEERMLSIIHDKMEIVGFMLYVCGVAYNSFEADYSWLDENV